MLCRLNIKNVALIGETEIEFSNGLNVLSGETGAGKSVVLDSINFVLGAKADKSMIRYGEEFCLVSCVFSNYPQSVSDILAEFDIEDNGEIIIKRKFDIKGNGYIKLNGENVTAAMLKKITVDLVDVHGQSEHFLLLGKGKQLECIDNGAKTINEKEELKNIISQIKNAETELSILGGTPEERAMRLDILNYQIGEIEKADLKEGEEDELISARTKILNLEKISGALAAVYDCVLSDGGASDLLGKAGQAIKQISSLGVEYDEISNEINECLDLLNGIGETAHDLLDDLDGGEINPDDIEKRLETYKNLKKKYGGDLQSINEFLLKAQKEKDDLSSFEEKCEKLNKEIKLLRQSAYKKCEELSEKRKIYAKDFCKKVTEKLKQLGMSCAKFEVEFSPLKSLNDVTTFYPSGLDEIEFMFSANVGEPLKPLSKIISGGEMSRFMLAIKTQAQSVCGTYIFDEIDAGLSGVAAGIVAKNFAEISKSRQIIAISHLPQISAMSDSSILIVKKELDGKTYTEVKPLDKLEKVSEIIRLIGGSDGDETAKNHAEHMIKEADEFKFSIKTK